MRTNEQDAENMASKDATITFRLKPDLKEEIEAAAEEDEIPLAQILREGAKIWLKERTKRKEGEK